MRRRGQWGAEDFEMLMYSANLVIFDNHRTGWAPKDRKRQILKKADPSNCELNNFKDL